jgi:hypothetical protein
LREGRLKNAAVYVYRIILIYIRNLYELLASKDGTGNLVATGPIALAKPFGDAPDGRETIAWFDAVPALETEE